MLYIASHQTAREAFLRLLASDLNLIFSFESQYYDLSIAYTLPYVTFVCKGCAYIYAHTAVGAGATHGEVQYNILLSSVCSIPISLVFLPRKARFVEVSQQIIESPTANMPHSLGLLF